MDRLAEVHDGSAAFDDREQLLRAVVQQEHQDRRHRELQGNEDMRLLRRSSQRVHGDVRSVRRACNAYLQQHHPHVQRGLSEGEAGYCRAQEADQRHGSKAGRYHPEGGAGGFHAGGHGQHRRIQAQDEQPCVPGPGGTASGGLRSRTARVVSIPTESPGGRVSGRRARERAFSEAKCAGDPRAVRRGTLGLGPVPAAGILLC